MGTRVLMAGGGTGGHAFPAIAIADEIRRRRAGAEIRFIGTRRGVEMRAVPRAGYPIEVVPVIGLRRALSIDLLKFPFILAAGLIRTFRTVRRFRPAVVVCTGGYVSGPAGIAAYLLSVPVVVQEQNSFPGLTTRLLSRIAAQVHVTFSASRRYLGGRGEVSGNPTRVEIGSIGQSEARLRMGLRPDLSTLLVFGGSQGSHAINTAVGQALPALLEGRRLQVLWQTGHLDFESVSKLTRTFGDFVTVLAFIDDMAAALGAADLAACRAGATTIAELARAGLPAVFVPLPTAAEDHQTKNAQVLVRAGAARMIPQRDLDGQRLAQTALDLLNDPAGRRAMSDRMRAFSVPDAAARIVDAIERAGLLKERV
ncbi:MAG: undecaprenyldiphospho-muramoylpentapeptide beta-N-acetylglucosaminyltransferase [Candidatus Handelsmanbacteria bacterium RIFCSPLOWO2_12_FULL_64_10]|uniref:UDP-N-acetylglucosamine--N-acetylmuramyl-(pentapeptide) pyrophosphoryl-undecaprenol N-acetylglucosamine transferase n=1 Tax=Handelsmanbacteria sp. (strain RIFCSPLOWO2_12_FULL_64_10) TaxID=1817868 RepID=A0A1F6CSR4_HANXR|nr:MAG: undecaprenyldiphospho-muramoylpentapeptide beta-N-acetylglucosaminyltransferase [Candidatus Handelsmanbacteria bacterium RIFCSPLOWO2_12_FULL_64_10]